MTATDPLKRYPNARSSTIAFLQARDKKLAQLRSELSRRPEPRFAIVRMVKAVGDAFREWRA